MIAGKGGLLRGWVSGGDPHKGGKGEEKQPKPLKNTTNVGRKTGT